SNDVVQSNIIISNGKDGLLIDGGNNTIGGASKGLGNTFSGNGTGGSGFGISTSSSGGDSFFRNEIRSNASGGFLVKSSNEHIGNGDVSNGNDIFKNGGPGVLVHGNVSGNTIRGNSIFGNNGLGIDLSTAPTDTGDGPTLNDRNDTDTGPNHPLNTPTI